VSGVDYVDVPLWQGKFGLACKRHRMPRRFRGRRGGFDLELLDDQECAASSGNLGPNEQVGAGITPGKTYVYRVIGYANAPTQFVITSTQFINGPVSGTGATVGPVPAGNARSNRRAEWCDFTVNRNKTVIAQLVH